ncbi:MAG: putative Ubiquitin-conjugating enzyme E2 J1 [Streblomastix strix]|uniref:Putative Ubiquitin-conjugating enzyme E2 J1 n=1 Tax=Streblomastix strix TaxID=222440 RepID=A0A5J4W4G5_9EUKA|nr:MAG: putative Ubiquitin-conjugating enzyme E2 J1 [Streblomastix strix]
MTQKAQTKNFARSTTVKRILQEVKELQENGGFDKEFCAIPLEDNLYEIHFTIRGTPGSAFSQGLYHGRLVLSSDYPFAPPDIFFLTNNGRFAINQKICLSVSTFHPETWSPSHQIQSILRALSFFLPSPTEGAVGAIDYTDEERKKLALQSHTFICKQCHMDHSQFIGNDEVYNRILKDESSIVQRNQDALQVQGIKFVVKPITEQLDVDKVKEKEKEQQNEEKEINIEVKEKEKGDSIDIDIKQELNGQIISDNEQQANEEQQEQKRPEIQQNINMNQQSSSSHSDNEYSVQSAISAHFKQLPQQLVISLIFLCIWLFYWSYRRF